LLEQFGMLGMLVVFRPLTMTAIRQGRWLLHS